MVTSSQIRKIHTLKNFIGLDDDLYREMLMTFGVQSSKNLTDTEAGIFIEVLEAKAEKFENWVKNITNHLHNSSIRYKIINGKF